MLYIRGRVGREKPKAMSLKPDPLNAVLTIVNHTSQTVGFQVLSKDSRGATRLEGKPSEGCKGLSMERSKASLGLCTVWTRIQSLSISSVAPQSEWKVRAQSNHGLLLDTKVGSEVVCTYHLDFDFEQDCADEYRIEILENPYRVSSTTGHASLTTRPLFQQEKEPAPTFPIPLPSTSDALSALRSGISTLMGSSKVSEARLRPYTASEFPLHAGLADYADLEVIEALLERDPASASVIGTLVFDQDDTESGLYPLHLASCFVVRDDERDATIIRHLLRLHPTAISEPATSRRLLPLHMAIIAGASHAIVDLLWKAYPKGESIRDGDGRVPRDYLLESLSLPRLVQRLGATKSTHQDLPSHCHVFTPLVPEENKDQ